MKFCWTTLHVRDLDASIAFYQEFAHLEVARRFKPNDRMELAFLGEGPTELELICDGKTTDGDVQGISIGFMSEIPLEETIEKLNAKGFTKQSQIYSPNPAMRYFQVKDPDGFSVQFIEDRRGLQ